MRKDGADTMSKLSGKHADKKIIFNVNIDPDLDKEFEDALEKVGMNRTQYLTGEIHRFCLAIEKQLAEGPMKFKYSRNREKDTKNRKRNTIEPKRLNLSIDKRLKERLDRAVKYVEESRTQLITSFITKLIDDVTRVA
jgi:hypothetical protein